MAVLADGLMDVVSAFVLPAYFQIKEKQHHNALEVLTPKGWDILNLQVAVTSSFQIAFQMVLKFKSLQNKI